MRSIRSSLASGAPAPETLLRTGVIALLGTGFALGIAHALLDFDILVHSQALPGCAFRALFELPCPGCGMTHALLLLTQLRVGESLLAHPAALPGLAAAFVWSTRPDWLRPLQRDWLLGTALVALIGLWILRLLNAQ